MSHTKLLPCPFCGGSARSYNGFSPMESITYVWCNNQDCFLHDLDTDGGAPTIQQWNERTTRTEGWLVTGQRLLCDGQEETIEYFLDNEIDADQYMYEADSYGFNNIKKVPHIRETKS